MLCRQPSRTSPGPRCTAVYSVTASPGCPRSRTQLQPNASSRHTRSATSNACSAAAEIKLAIQRGELFRAHSFELACAQNDIDHRLTKPRHPWTNGQVERMNRTIKDATVKRFHYETHDQLRNHLTDFVNAYNFGRRLKALKGLTPYEAICKTWTKEPQRFTLDPVHQMPGLNTDPTDSARPSDAVVRPEDRDPPHSTASGRTVCRAPALPRQPGYKDG